MAATRCVTTESGTKLISLNNLKYKGLFTSNVAPTHRAYCILFSLFLGVLLITAGSVFVHVHSLHPVSGGHVMHTPPLPLSITLIILGIITMSSSMFIAYRYGMDDGDDSLEEDSSNFIKEDFLDREYNSSQYHHCHCCTHQHHCCNSQTNCSANHQNPSPTICTDTSFQPRTSPIPCQIQYTKTSQTQNKQTTEKLKWKSSPPADTQIHEKVVPHKPWLSPPEVHHRPPSAENVAKHQTITALNIDKKKGKPLHV